MPGSCDSHFHVFGPVEEYPYGSDLRYEPPIAPLEDYLSLARHLGLERVVFVQPSAYGRDNRCLLDAMSRIGAPCRGIVDVEGNISDAEMDELNSAGVRGVRINVSPIKSWDASLAATLLSRIEIMAARCAEIGWTLDLLLPGWLTNELMGTLEKLKLNFTLDHMGMFLARDGVTQPGFQRLLNLLRHGSGQCWVKITGVYRVSDVSDFEDADPLVRALIEAAPDRVIWGSDFPHLSFTDSVDSVQLFNLLARWVPDEAMRRKILVENPQHLYSF